MVQEIMPKFSLIFASISGALAVAIGAFGAHALKDFLQNNQMIDVFQTAVKYQFYHTLLLLIVGLLSAKHPSKTLKISSISLMLGIILFSGSLYLLIFTGQKFWGMITPIGGVFFLGGWGFLAYSVSESYKSLF